MGEIAVDAEFIQEIEHRPKATVTEAEGIPVIDLSSNDVGGLIREIGEACEKWGFFQVINHGVSFHIMKDMDDVFREFFRFPLEEKRKVRREEDNPMGYYETEHTKNVRDWKEVFDFTAQDITFIPVSPYNLQPKPVVNLWPMYPIQLREIGQEYAREMEKLGFKLIELIAMSLGLQEKRLNEFFKDSMSFVRVNHYPPCPSTDLVLGVGPHKDAGALAILAQDSVGGLEVRPNSFTEWVRVKPNPGAFIINVGDVIQAWSNGKYESVEHRVMANPAKDRLSIPFFFMPSHYVMIKPLEELTDENNPPKYKHYNWGSFLASRRLGNFKKLNVDTIHISHFKIPGPSPSCQIGDIRCPALLKT